MTTTDDPVAAFIEAACVAFDDHTRGDLEAAEALRRAHGEIGHDVFTAAILGDDAVLASLLAAEPTRATEPGGLRAWDPLTYLCFSRYLRLDGVRAPQFVRSARLLLDHGADPNTGFYWQEHAPQPSHETAIYGAAGLAQHAELTRLLLERGADPNDDETPYHLAEASDNTVMELVVESGRFNEDSLATLLVRKHDAHDEAGIAWLLAHGANPNRLTMWGVTALHHAIRRNNALSIIERLLDHAADPTIRGTPSAVDGAGIKAEGRSASAIAARAGRADVLELFERRGLAVELAGVDRLVAACARDDASAMRAIASGDPALVRELVDAGGELLATFASIGNTAGIARLLELGVQVDARFARGNSYFGVAPDSTALHVAAWCARHDTVELLIARGARVDALDGKGRTALALAVRACVDSYWTARRQPSSVRALLVAGASADAVEPFPSGYREVDELIAPHRPSRPA